jgi:hypothetical protein
MQIQLLWNYLESSQILVRAHNLSNPKACAQTLLLHEALYRGPTHSSMPGAGGNGNDIIILHNNAIACAPLLTSLHLACIWNAAGDTALPLTQAVLKAPLTNAVLVQEHCTKLIAHKLP